MSRYSKYSIISYISKNWRHVDAHNIFFTTGTILVWVYLQINGIALTLIFQKSN